MVNLIKRMRKLHEKAFHPHITGRMLLWIRVGPGALILPKEVTKISMEFNKKINGGHRGARHFWHEMLPRVKFRNPTVPIAIRRHEDADGPSLLHIYTSTNAASSPGAATTPADDSAPPTHTIDIRNKHESEILDLLVEKTGAVQLQPTEQELEEQREVAEFKIRSEQDRVDVREKLVKQRREEQLLKLARGETIA